ncbi:hypothetical protein E4K10_18280 [Streptomyces sp. T1317-0309]|nr:hypothetical protein E4K10_18280 [Streptomyces sp. T1317-0309]
MVELKNYAVPSRLYFSAFNITEATKADSLVVLARQWAGAVAVPLARFRVGIYSLNGGQWRLLQSSAALEGVPPAGQIPGSPTAATTANAGPVAFNFDDVANLPVGRYYGCFVLSQAGHRTSRTTGCRTSVPSIRRSSRTAQRSRALGTSPRRRSRPPSSTRQTFSSTDRAWSWDWLLLR